MRPVFADTFYWIALTVPTDAAHERAVQFRLDILTTDEVLAEYLNFFSAAPERIKQQAGMNVHRILRDESVRVIPQTRESFLGGLELYSARPDKGYSLIDCISMYTMRIAGLTEVLTNDRHFEQEGFRALFRDS